MAIIELNSVIKDMAAGPFGSNLKVSCFVDYGFPIIDGANLKGCKVTDNISKFVTKEKAYSLKRSIAKRNDVVVTISGTLGQISYIPKDSAFEEYLCSQRQFRITFDETKVYVPYIVFYFHTYEGQQKILSFANQVGVPALSQPLKNFRAIKIDLPSYDKQKKIASFIEKINDKIELNKKINDNLSIYKSNESTSISPDISLGRSASRRTSSLTFSSILADNFKYRDSSKLDNGSKSSLRAGNNKLYAGKAFLLRCKTVVPLTYPRQCSLKRLSCRIPAKRNFEIPFFGNTLTKSIEKTIFSYFNFVNKTSALPITSAFCVKSVCATRISNNSAVCWGFNFEEGRISLKPSSLNPPFLSKFLMVAIAMSLFSNNSEPLYEYPPINRANSDKLTFSHPSIWSSGEYGRKCVIAA